MQIGVMFFCQRPVGRANLRGGATAVEAERCVMMEVSAFQRRTLARVHGIASLNMIRRP